MQGLEEMKETAREINEAVTLGKETEAGINEASQLFIAEQPPIWLYIVPVLCSNQSLHDGYIAARREVYLVGNTVIRNSTMVTRYPAPLPLDNCQSWCFSTTREGATER